MRIITNLTFVSLAAGLLASTGCRYSEGLIIENVDGKVYLPRSAAQRTLVFEDATAGTSETVELEDVRLIGPVYLGLYPSVKPAGEVESYSHPEVGPQFRAGVAGDTYPYGGTTIGDLRFACFEFLTCKVVSGRYLDFNDIVDWFGNQVRQPILDASGAEITNGEFIRQVCFDLLDATADEEVRITQTEDRDGDDEITANDLDFTLDETIDLDEDGTPEGAYVADFRIWQQEWFWDVNQERDSDCVPGGVDVDPSEACTGFSLWGWHDAPSTLTYQYSTCNTAAGFTENTYNNDFEGGAAFGDVLNQPAIYIGAGDHVARDGYIWSDVDDVAELILDFEVE